MCAVKNKADRKTGANDIILTGWGWKEYAVAAAVALRALGAKAEVMGMSKRRLPEFLEEHGGGYRAIYIIGISLGGDVERLAKALSSLRAGGTKVVWISSIPLDDPQRKVLPPLIETFETKPKQDLFNGALVKATGEYFKENVSDVMPFAKEGATIPKSIPRYHDLISAAMYAYRNYRDEKTYSEAIRYLACGVSEEGWSERCREAVAHYHRYGGRELVGDSEAIKDLRERINLVAASPDARVLILGESGTGKETVALQIHTRSRRRNEPFLAYNCASVAPQLLESAFFGHERGAFTSADSKKPGLFELANGGTLFLDEVGELPIEAQGILLRVLETRRFMRVGGTVELETDVRLITATNRNLPAMVREGKFRADLYMRINVATLSIPPLRERPEDIARIADSWWLNKFHKHLSDEQKAALAAYSYPGNVRELFNILERAVVFKENDFARLIAEHRQINADLYESSSPAGRDAIVALSDTDIPDDLDSAIRAHVRRVFTKHGGNVSKAAAALKITRTTLHKWLDGFTAPEACRAVP